MPITKNQFFKLEKGDKLISKTGRIREILSTGNGTVELKKLNVSRYKSPNTIYTFHDVKNLGFELYNPPRNIIAEMEEVCLFKFDDGWPAAFPTLGQQDEEGNFMVRITRHSLFRSKTLKGAIIKALDDFKKGN